MIKAPIILSLLLLAACSTTSGMTPEPVVVTKTVNVPVAVKCVPDTLSLPPVYVDTDTALKAAPDAAVRYQLLAAGRSQRIGRLKDLEAIVSGCK